MDDSAAAPLPGKNPKVLPTPSLNPAEFEDFTERLLSAHRFCSKDIVHVVDVERWGRPGDKQHGIDFKGMLSDGSTAAWQCKRLDALAPADVRDAVKATSYVADRYFLTYSGEASSDVRIEIAKHQGWEIIDQRGLGRMLDDLPLTRRRDVLDATFGRGKRKYLVDVPGEDAFWSLEAFLDDRRDANTLLNDLTPLVGRGKELESLRTAIDRTGEGLRVVTTVVGPGGRGKTRLITEMLADLQERQPEIPVFCLAPGRIFDQTALEELPQTPAVIFIDDAHLDTDALRPLLTYARTVPETQLVLATRPSAAPAVANEINLARIAPAAQAVVTVSELTSNDARSLVEGLSAGLGLSLALREYLSGQATHSPNMAVITTNLIRSGELTTALPVDAGLRAQVLSRYQELRAANIARYDQDTVRKTIATYTALQPNLEDEDLAAQLAEFCGLERVPWLRLNKELIDRGILLIQGEHARVVPDILGDSFLEEVAAVGTVDTGFATSLWTTFGASHHARLVTALAELDWRLRFLGGPGVMDTVWAAIDVELGSDRYSAMSRELKLINDLASTQPDALTDRLDAIRIRLTTDPPPPFDQAAADELDELGGGDPMDSDHYRIAAGFAPIDASDVLELLAPMYTSAARANPELYERALDALWDLRRRDPRPPNQHSSHPERCITDELANLTKMPRVALAEQVIDRVEAWLQDPGLPTDLTTPLFALEPLLAKEGMQFVADTRRSWSYRTWAINPERVATARERIRGVLLHIALGEDLRRAGHAIRLLETALRVPRGFNGNRPPEEQLNAWNEDDLATIATLNSIARTTELPFIRRLVRRAVSWKSEYAIPIAVRTAALELVTHLDNVVTLDDDLAETTLNPESAHVALSRRGKTVPARRDLADALAAEAKRAEESKNGRGIRDNLHEFVDHSRNEATERVTAVTAQLLKLDDRTLIETLNTNYTIGNALQISSHLGPWPIYTSIVDQAPDRIAGLVEQIARQPGPCDERIEVLIGAWLSHNEKAACEWLATLSDQRPAVRSAVSDGFGHHQSNWLTEHPHLLPVYTAGLSDPDLDLRSRYLSNSGPYLKADPATAVPALISAGINDMEATRALESAAQYNGISWGATLSQDDAAAVLALTDYAGYNRGFGVTEGIAAGIAKNYPALVLDHFSTSTNVPYLDDQQRELAQVFADQAPVFAAWLRDVIADPERQTGRVVGAVVIKLERSHAAALIPLLSDLDSAELDRLVDALGHADGWALHQPDLTSAIYARARELDVLTELRPRLVAAMQLTFWSGIDGESEELNTAHAQAEAAILQATDPDSLADFQIAEQRMNGAMGRDRALYEGDLEGL